MINKVDNVLRLFFGDMQGSLYATEMAWDRYSDDLEYLSFVGYKSTIDEVSRLMKMNDNIYIRVSGGGYCYKRKNNHYHMEVTKAKNSDMYHAVITAKDNCVTEERGENWLIYLFVKEDGEDKEARLKTLLLDKLNKYSSVPILPEWIDYIYYKVEDDIRECYATIMEGTPEVLVYRLSGNQAYIKDIISEGLSSGLININGSNNPSVLLEESTGLNDYLSMFGSILADKIQTKFKPKFVPGTDMYSNALMTLDDYIHHKGIELYTAQMGVIQACANNFNLNKYSFIVSEMGSGKQ